MKYLLLSLLLATQAFANERNDFWVSLEGNEFCENVRVKMGNMIRTKPLKVFNYNDMSYVLTRSNDGMRELFVVEDNKMKSLFTVAQDVRDILRYEDNLWVMKDYSIEKWSLNGEILNRYQTLEPTWPQSARNYRAKDFAAADGVLYIANGLHGLVLMSMSDGSILSKHNLRSFQPKEGRYSMVVAVTVDNDDVFLGVTRGTPGAFNGIAQYSIKSNKILNAAMYDERRVGVVGINPMITSNKDSVLLNNGGWAHIIKKSDLTKKKIRPKWLAHKMNNENSWAYATMIGDITMTETDFYGCASVMLRDENDNHFLKNIGLKRSLK